MNTNTSNTALVVVEVVHNDRVNRFGENPTSFFSMTWDLVRPRAIEALAKKLTSRGGMKSYLVRDETGKVILEVDS